MSLKHGSNFNRTLNLPYFGGKESINIRQKRTASKFINYKLQNISVGIDITAVITSSSIHISLMYVRILHFKCESNDSRGLFVC